MHKIIVQSQIPAGTHLSVHEDKAEALRCVFKNKPSFERIIEDVEVPDGIESEDLFKLTRAIPDTDNRVTMRVDMLGLL